jgi:hypothetical protein
MGLFSWDCEGCGHPLLMPENTNRVNAWMNECVAITKDGTVVEGFYDGYGRLADTLANVPGWDENGMHTTRGKTSISPDVYEECPTVYHRACWELFGCPRDYAGPSKNSNDQGHFFDEGRHDMDRPTSLMNLRHGHKASRRA